MESPSAAQAHLVPAVWEHGFWVSSSRRPAQFHCSPSLFCSSPRPWQGHHSPVFPSFCSHQAQLSWITSSPSCPIAECSPRPCIPQQGRVPCAALQLRHSHCTVLTLNTAIATVVLQRATLTMTCGLIPKQGILTLLVHLPTHPSSTRLQGSTPNPASY